MQVEEAFKTKKDAKWVNKQRTLVVSSRGITERHRHLMLDLINLMPQSKKEAKLEKKDVPSQISELCYIHTCANFVYFETRKRTDLYMWIGRFPDGPSVKFLVENIHTSNELQLSGNCVKGSRPILSFDQNFKEDTQLKLMRELFVHAFNIPRYHPKSKPTVDHIYNFAMTDNRIWFRNYQIATEDLGKSLESQELYEVGPRFVLNPIAVLSGSMIGETLYKNPIYKTRSKLKSERNKARRDAMIQQEMKKSKKEKTVNQETEFDEVDDVFDINDRVKGKQQNNEGDEDNDDSYDSLEDEDEDDEEQQLEGEDEDSQE